MWLDELNDLVVELSTKIDQHREILQKSESSTRYCLIDPLLTALGWDLSDPAQVLTEYNSGQWQGRLRLGARKRPAQPCCRGKVPINPDRARDRAVDQLLSSGWHQVFRGYER